MPTYTYDHIHLRTRDPQGLAEFFHRIFDAQIIESIHFGFRVDNLDETVAELKRRGADIAVEPRTIRPGVKIAFVRAPDDVRIELLQRD